MVVSQYHLPLDTPIVANAVLEPAVFGIKTLKLAFDNVVVFPPVVEIALSGFITA